MNQWSLRLTTTRQPAQCSDKALGPVRKDPLAVRLFGPSTSVEPEVQNEEFATHRPPHPMTNAAPPSPLLRRGPVLEKGPRKIRVSFADAVGVIVIQVYVDRPMSHQGQIDVIPDLSG